MEDIVDVTPPTRYSFEERQAARLVLNKSPFFLVLGLGIQFESKPLPELLTTCSNPDALLKIVNLTGKGDWSHGDKARVLIQLRGQQSPKARVRAASRIVSAMGALFSYDHHTYHNDFVPYQIPKGLQKGTRVRVEDIEELEARTGIGPYPDDIVIRLGSCVIIAPTNTARIFYLLPFVLQDEHLFDACNFFRSSYSEYSFIGGVVRDILREPKRGPENESERLALEHVVLQSLRTRQPGSHEQETQPERTGIRID